MTTDAPRRFKIRIVVLALLCVVWMGLIGRRLTQLQVVESSDLLNRAERQQQFSVNLAAMRGQVFDCSGRELIRSAETESVYASPYSIDDRSATAAALAKALKTDVDGIMDRLDSGKFYVAIKRRLTFDEADKVRALGLVGVELVKEPKRFYPQGDLAAQLLGFSNLDGAGVSGVEASFDKVLLGKPGHITVLTDARHRPYDRVEEPSLPGQDITLTIDSAIQAYTEKFLASAVQSSGAKHGVAVVIQPQTGKVLAIANAPLLNPNGGHVEQEMSDRATEQPYEPGSVFKVITYSAALEAKLITPESIIDAQGGSITISGHTIRDEGHYGKLTAMDALAKSSNVAAIKIGRQLGSQRLYDCMKKFGLGERVGRDLGTESRGLVRKVSRWSDASFGAIPIGYEVGVTPLQLAAAIATIANDGVMVQPHIVQKISGDSADSSLLPPLESHRVVSAETAASMKRMLANVVLHGTGKKAQLNGYTSAGKTGTAHKFDQATKRYSPNHYYASFGGFAPVDHPQVAILVMIDDPRGSYFGGDVAAPVFQQIAEAALNRLGVQPDSGKSEERLVASNAQSADSNGASIGEAVLLPGVGLGDGGIASDASDENGAVADRRVAVAGNTQTAANAASARLIAAVTETSSSDGALQSALIRLPDLRGHGARSAAEICAQLGLKVNAQGEGVVIAQKPRIGASVAPGSTCYLTLGR